MLAHTHLGPIRDQRSLSEALADYERIERDIVPTMRLDDAARSSEKVRGEELESALSVRNLALLGRREVDVYGTVTVEEIRAALEKRARDRGRKLSWVVSNHEGELVDALNGAVGRVDAALFSANLGDTYTATAVPSPAATIATRRVERDSVQIRSAMVRRTRAGSDSPPVRSLDRHESIDSSPTGIRARRTPRTVVAERARDAAIAGLFEE